MKSTRWVPMLLLVALIGPVQSAPDKNHIYLVVAQSGKCTVAGKPISLLSYLSIQDTVSCPPNGSLTVTNVLTGARYQISGQTALAKELVPNHKTIKTVRQSQEQRQGIEVSHQVDMSKYGGYTSRSLGVKADAPIPVSLEKLPVVLDLTLSKHKLDGPNPMIRYRKVNDHGYPEYVRAVVSPDGNRLTLPDLKIPPDQTTMIFFGDPEKTDGREVSDGQASFAVTVINPKLEKKLRTVRKMADKASELEAYEAYCQLEVYWPARQLRDSLLKQYPEARGEIGELFKKWIEPVPK